MKKILLPLLLLALGSAHADEAGRDPTAWPPALRSAISAAAPAASAATSDPAEAGIRQLVFAEGRAYVVQRGRRYGVGERLDGARIERISEQAVWLREGGQLRREPLYGGVEKRPPAPPAPSSATAAAAVVKKKSKE